MNDIFHIGICGKTNQNLNYKMLRESFPESRVSYLLLQNNYDIV